MREILFRGKLLASGEWSYGNLDIKPGGKVAIITPDNTLIGKYGQVDPSTVGQYTGLLDRNGVKIFEGDLLLVGADRKNPVQVRFINFSWECTADPLWPRYRHRLESDSLKYEVVGNIYDGFSIVRKKGH